MKILFIAPLPPPVNGQSLAADTLYKKLITCNEVSVVNMAKPKRVKNLIDWIDRLLSVVSFFFQIINKKKGANLIYLTISESTGGNIKDIIIYLICYRRLDRMCIHMLGGAGMRHIITKGGFQYHLNRFFIKKLKAVIVEGSIQADTFSKVISRDKIHIIPNFAENYLFSSISEVEKKFENLSVINILYLSNLIYGKGYIELLDAFISLNPEIKKHINVSFVGGFHSDKFRDDFLKKIENECQIAYLGKFISGSSKKELYLRSHVFCLPTYYPFEGQPISILEAYATGCVVVTTDHSGIPEIFTDEINGFLVKKKSSDSIKLVIEKIVSKKEDLMRVALFNQHSAFNKYRPEIYVSRLFDALHIPV